jgi:uncharacterized protein (DUF58 family)
VSAPSPFSGAAAAAGGADPEALARLATLTLRANRVVEGVLTGLHRSPHHGSSIEFAEHKEYAPGDDIRHVDWKVYGRADRFYLKKFEDETNLRAFLVVDVSGSMGYPDAGSGATGTARLTKLAYASVMAAALAHLLVRQHDAVGLLTFAERPATFLPPRAATGYLVNVLGALDQARPAGKTDLAAAIAFLAETARRRAAILLFTDLWHEREAALAGLRQLAARRHDVSLFHVLDPDELQFPFEGLARFRSLEAPDEVLADPLALRAEYLAALGEHLAAVKRGCQEAGVDYRLCDTARPPVGVLLDFLSARSR